MAGNPREDTPGRKSESAISTFLSSFIDRTKSPAAEQVFHIFTGHFFLIYFRWVTVNDVLAYEEPCFFCATCFKGLHYSHSGEKICDFQAYPVVGDFDWWFNVRTCSKWKSTQRKGTRSTIGKANSKMYILTCDPWPTKSKTHEPFLLMANILSEAFLCEGIKPRKEQQYVAKVIRFRNRDSQRYSKSFRLKFLLWWFHFSKTIGASEVRFLWGIYTFHYSMRMTIVWDRFRMYNSRC